MQAEPASPEPVDLSGPRTLRNADETRSVLLDALRGPSPIRLDCSAVTEADLSFVQLLLAARKSAEGAGKDVTLAPAPSPAFDKAAKRAGFPVSLDLHSGGAWLGRE
jgi:hypothetical protein